LNRVLKTEERPQYQLTAAQRIHTEDAAVDPQADRTRVAYMHPPLTDEQRRELCVAYTSITSRRVWPRTVLPLLLVCARVHGPDTIRLLRELHEQHGPHNLLLRLRDHVVDQGDVAVPPARLPVVDDAAPQSKAEAPASPEPPQLHVVRDEWDLAGLDADPSVRRAPELPIDEDGSYVGLVYGPDNRPAFNPADGRRWDRPNCKHTADRWYQRADGSPVCGTCYPRAEGVA
jgi:hypothetical protein